jgi:hypothetical protein
MLTRNLTGSYVYICDSLKGGLKIDSSYKICNGICVSYDWQLYDIFETANDVWVDKY